MTTIRSTYWIVGLTMLAAAIAGCPSAQPGDECQSDTDCGQLVCNLQAGVCVECLEDAHCDDDSSCTTDSCDSANECVNQAVECGFVAALSGAQEVPPVASNGTGQGTFTLSIDRTELSFDVTASGLSGPVVAAHFHRGDPDEAGPIVVNLNSFISEENGVVTLTGTVSATQMADDLVDGRIYVNLHTDDHVNGEIRGQLTPE